MIRRKIWLALSMMGALPIGVAQAQVNGIVSSPYVGFGRPDSTVAITNSNSVNPGNASVSDTFAPGATGTNRHDFLLSTDNGATAHTFDIDDSFTFSTLINLSALSNSPRKEAGIRINSSVTGDALFIINSDAGEIVAFGGGAPFKSFGNNGGGNGYTPGTTILMGIREIGGGDGAGGVANTLEYFIDRDPFNPGGESTSGPLPWSNLEKGPLAFNVVLYAQGGPALDAADSFNAVFTNISYTREAAIPEPATCALTMLGLAALGFIRSRRSR